MKLTQFELYAMCNQSTKTWLVSEVQTICIKDFFFFFSVLFFFFFFFCLSVPCFPSVVSQHLSICTQWDIKYIPVTLSFSSLRICITNTFPEGLVVCLFFFVFFWNLVFSVKVITMDKTHFILTNKGLY